MTDLKPDIVLVHSSDLHVDDDPAEPSYGTDGTSGLRWVLDTAREAVRGFCGAGGRYVR